METAPKQLRWITFQPNDYVHLLNDSYRADFVGEVFRDLIRSLTENKEPNFVSNFKAIEKSKAIWKERLAKNAKSKAAREQFCNTKVEIPTREEAIEFGKSINAKFAEQWFEFSEANNWRDKFGNPIRNWKRALNVFEKYMLNKEVAND